MKRLNKKNEPPGLVPPNGSNVVSACVGALSTEIYYIICLLMSNNVKGEGKMKKLGISLLAALVALGIAGCGPQEESSKVITDNDKTTSATDSGTTSAPEEQKATVGQTVTGEKWAISLTGAKVYDKIDDEYLPIEPAEGKQYLVLFFDVENVSAEDDYFNYFNIESYVDGYNSQISVLLGDVEGYQTLTGDVAAGKKLQGYLAWEVDPEWKELEVSYKDDVWTGSKAATFVVTPDNLA